jgi:hypothetical protein
MVRQMRISTMLAKVETTEGTDSAPAAAQGFFAMLSPPSVPGDFRRVSVHTGAGSMLPGVMGPHRVEQRAEVLLRGAGAAYSASVLPKSDALLRACGFAAAGSFGVGTEKWDYTLRSTGFESFSVYSYMAGDGTNTVLHKLLGCRGLPTLHFPLGAIARLEANLRALYTAPADAAIVTPTGEPSLAYPVMLSSALQIGTQNFAAKHGEITIDLARRIEPRGGGIAATGYEGMEMLADREPTLTFEAEATTEAGFPFWANLIAATKMDCTFQVGSVQYNRVKVNIPVMQFERLEMTERNGVAMYRAACILVSPTGINDEITLTFD